MTTVRIDVHEPLDAALRSDLERVLHGQDHRPAGWADLLLADLCERVSGAYGAFLRASDQGRMLGGALLLSRREVGEDQARPWLAALWVDPSVRSQGLGRRLVQLAEAQARSRGARELVITLNPEDDAALYMTERWGYFRETVVVSKGL